MECAYADAYRKSKYPSEIVHANPMWIHIDTAAVLRIATGDCVEITTYRPLSGKRGDHAFGANGDVVGSARVKAFVTQDIHPKVVAVSNSVGYTVSSRAATGRQGARAIESADGSEGYGAEPQHDDLAHSVWWDQRKGGRGHGHNINATLPINPQPLVGMQAWFDTVCTVRKVSA